MADDLKHLEEHSDEIRELVETLVQNHLLEAANANQYGDVPPNVEKCEIGIV